MTVARFPSLAHWGAFTALVERGRIIGCEPFARDPTPSSMLEAIPAMVHSPLRIARPAIREGWREGKPRTGTVQKVSNLILNMNIYVRDASSGATLAAMSADMRGNTDESWSRTLDWLIRNRLLTPDYGARH